MRPVTTLRLLLGTIRHSIEGADGPPLAWTLRRYRPDQAPRDVVAGLTVTALIIPLAIGYAGVAGLPPEMGLYASLAPLVAYAIFGSGRRLIVGPDASTAALIGVTIAPLAAAADDRVRIASALGLVVAGLFVAMRLGRMGFLADLLSRPILVGYMAGVGVTVAAGQVAKMAGGPAIADGLGVLTRIEWRSSDAAAVAEAVGIAFRQSGADFLSLAIGVGAVVAMLIGRRFLPRFPVALVVMLVGMSLSYVAGLQARGVQVLGPVPAGLGSLGIPFATPTELFALLPGAIGLAIMSFADTAVTGRSFAAKHGERTDPDRELVALAAADAAGALTGGYPVSSSPSRTSAAEAAGSTSQATGLVAAAGVAVVLLLFTTPLSYLPIPVLGGVIFVSVLGLIDIRGLRAIWRLRPSEGLIGIVTMGGVIIYGTLVGVAIAVLLATLNIVRRSASPDLAEEGRLPDGSWHDLSRDATARRVSGVLTLRMAGPLFFANATGLQARVRSVVASRPDVQAVVLDLAATSDVDVTGGDALRELRAELARHDRRLAVAQPMGRVRDQLRTYDLEALMDPTAGTRGTVDQVVAGLGLDPATMAPDEGRGTAGAPAPGGGLLDLVPPGVIPAGQERLVVRIVVGGVAVIAGAVLLGALLGWMLQTAPGGTGTVPDLVGMSLEDGSAAADDAGFTLGDPIDVRRDDVPEGTIVDQDPPAGTIADLGAEIQPLVSTGRQLVVVPEVIGLREAEAIAQLAAAGLTVGRASTAADPVAPVGTVIATIPAPGTSVAVGTSVGLVVSTGPAASP